MSTSRRQSTGEFSVAGGYSTADGFIGEVSVGERNLLGRGQYAKAAVQYGQRARGFEFSFVEPYLPRLSAAGGRRRVSPSRRWRRAISPTTTRPTAASCASASRSREDLTLQAALLDLSAGDRAAVAIQQLYSRLPTCRPIGPSCYATAMPRCRSAGAGGRPGDHLAGRLHARLQHARQQQESRPAASWLEFKQDFAGVGGDVNFIRSTVDARIYYEMLLGRGRRVPRPGRPHRRLGRQRPAHARPLLHGPEPGARLRAGRHRPARPDARARPRTRSAARMYWGASVEVQFAVLSCRRTSA